MVTNSGNAGKHGTIRGDSTPHARGDTADQAGSSFSPMKQPLTFEDQIAHLRDKGLRIDDDASAMQHLSEANYYRLRGFWMTLEEADSFISGTTFDDVWNIYQFDGELRQWLAAVIEPIEIKLRTQFAYVLAHRYGPRAHLQQGHFAGWNAYQRTMKSYRREKDKARNSSVPCVVHNVNKYGELPIWAAVEVMSMGNVSSLLGNLKDLDDIKEVARAFDIRAPYLKSWMHHLTYIRNICAHHNRFYNRVITTKPRMYRRDQDYDTARCFPTFLVLKQLYTADWSEEWVAKLRELKEIVEKYPTVDLAPMGFPNNWYEVLSTSVRNGGETNGSIPSV